MKYFYLGIVWLFLLSFRLRIQPYTGGDEEEVEPLPPNPFSELIERDLDDYKHQVEHQQLGLDGNPHTLCISYLYLAS